ASRLTPIGFRRDIKLFLAALAGFLVVIILTLLVLLLNMTATASDQLRERWRLSTEVASDEIAAYSAATNGPPLNKSTLDSLRARYQINGIIFHPPAGNPIRSGYDLVDEHSELLHKQSPAGPIDFIFDASQLQGIQRLFRWTAGISLASTMLATLLLVFYLPRILRPIEEMLAQAESLGDRAPHVDEAQYLIETFRSSISTLKIQERELKRLHELERTRADDLQRITATLTRSLTSGFIALDQSRKVVDINQAAREILHLSADDDVSGREIPEVFGDGPFAERLREAIDDRQNVSRVEVAHSSGGEVVTVGLTTVPLMGEDEKFLGVIALFADLTPIKLLEHRVRDMKNLADLGEISAGIAHEFRNSLATILGYIRLASREQLPEGASQRLQKAEAEAALLSGAVEGLLNFARPMKLDNSELDLGEVVREVAEKIRDQSEAVPINMDLQPTMISGDRGLLTRALENVVRNAVESVIARGENGAVRLRCRPRPWPRLEISDDGIGFDPDDAPRLLLPFQSEKPSGMGLGLPLARKIVLLHGGTLTLNGRPGAGATVLMEFPPEGALGNRKA
ncbi:MAG: ATP-binding protein, partial [Acidobacteriota bacterium]